MQLILKLKKGNRFLDYLPSQGFCAHLQATDRQSCIQELSAALCEGTQLDPERTAKAAWSREQIMSTGLPNRMAVPHARLEGIKTGLVALGFSKSGIDFDSQDGLPARLIFLILTPADDHRIQIEILSDIARTFRNPEMVEKALQSGNFTEFRAFIKSEPSERLS